MWPFSNVVRSMVEGKAESETRSFLEESGMDPTLATALGALVRALVTAGVTGGLTVYGHTYSAIGWATLAVAVHFLETSPSAKAAAKDLQGRLDLALKRLQTSGH